LTAAGPVPAATRPAVWRWLGRVPFGPTAELQERLRADILSGQAPETLLLCEHDPVVTLGRRTRPEHLLVGEQGLASRGIAVAVASRGGEATYHGPGQLVAYPVVRLARGVLAHVEAMAAAVIDLLAGVGVQDARWNRSSPGVWIGPAKICAFGIHVRHRIAVHGLALNVSPDLSAFATIVPCGIPGAAVTSIEQQLGSGHAAAAPAPLVSELAPELARSLARRLGLTLSAGPSAKPNCKTVLRTDIMIKA
jgi:lipoate-protein ligase B